MNNKLKQRNRRGLFHKRNILDTIMCRRLHWAGEAWRSQNTLIRMVIEEHTNGKGIFFFFFDISILQITLKIQKNK